MPASTPVYGFPYPLNSDLVRDAYQDVYDLADAVESKLNVLPGLIRMKPSTSASANISFDSKGVGTPSLGATSFTIGNLFTTQYDVYRIIWQGGSSTTSNVISVLYPQQPSTIYFGRLFFNRPNNSTASIVTDSSNTRHTWLGWGGLTVSMDFEVYSPAHSVRTGIVGQYLEVEVGDSAAVGQYVGFLNTTTPVTSITVSLLSGTISRSGKVVVYAYNT